MVNKYTNTKEIVKEYQKAWWDYRYKKEIIIMFIVLIIGIIMLVAQLLENRFKLMSVLSFIILPIMYFGMYLYKKKRAFKMEKERFNEIYKDVKNKEVTIRFDNVIKVTTNKNTTEVSYDKIKKYVDTKNLIVLLLKEDTTIALKKDSFVNGTEKECKKILDEKIKSSKKGNKNVPSMGRIRK